MIIRNHKNKTGIVNLLSYMKFLSIFMGYLYYNVIFLYSVSLNSAPPPCFHLLCNNRQIGHVISRDVYPFCTIANTIMNN